jgi:hypothetical protein
VVVRPSYVLGGRAMEVVYDEAELNRYMVEAVQVEPDHPVLIDQYLENAVEVDVDALCDLEGRVVIGGLMEHIEPAGIHSGDSACALPAAASGAPTRLSPPPITTRPPPTGISASKASPTRSPRNRSSRSTATSRRSVRWPTSRSSTSARASST